MKKFFAFVIAMAMTVVANAAPIDFAAQTDGSYSIVVTPGYAITGSDFIIKGDIDTSSVVFSTSYVKNFMGYGVASPWLAAPSRSEALSNSLGGYVVSVAASASAADAAIGDTLPGFPAGEAGPTVILSGLKIVGGVVDLVSYSTDYISGGQITHFTDGAVMASVPEPMTMSLLGLGGLVAARRRRA